MLQKDKRTEIGQACIGITVQVEVVVSCCCQPRTDQDLGRLSDHLLIDLLVECIPGIVTHRGRAGESIVQTVPDRREDCKADHDCDRGPLHLDEFTYLISYV